MPRHEELEEGEDGGECNALAFAIVNTLLLSTTFNMNWVQFKRVDRYTHSHTCYEGWHAIQWCDAIRCNVSRSLCRSSAIDFVRKESIQWYDGKEIAAMCIYRGILFWNGNENHLIQQRTSGGLPHLDRSKPTEREWRREDERMKMKENSTSDALKVDVCAMKWIGMLQSKSNSKRHIWIGVTLVLFFILFFSKCISNMVGAVFEVLNGLNVTQQRIEEIIPK